MSRYERSLITAEPLHQQLARGLEFGTRFHSSPVVRMSDARPVHLGHVVEADGRWRIIIFASRKSPSDPSSEIHALAQFLDRSADSPIGKYTPPGSDVDSVIEVITVFQQDYRELEFSMLPELLWPPKGKYGLRDCDKIFCPAIDGSEEFHDARQIDRDAGCMVIVRPDQHVANVLPFDDYANLANFFDRFMLPVAS